MVRIHDGYVRSLRRAGTCILLLTGLSAATSVQAVSTDDEVAAAKADTEKWNALKAKSDAEAAAFKARQAASEAEAAAAKSAFGPLGSYEGAKGDIKLGTDAGQLEGSLLTGLSLERAAFDIASASKVRMSARRIAVLSGDEAYNFDVLDAYQAKVQGIDDLMRSAVVACPTGGRAPAFVPIAAIGAAVDLAARLFRSDFDVSAIKVAPDDVLMARSLASELVRQGFSDVRLPSQATGGALVKTNVVFEDTKALGKFQRERVLPCISTLRKSPKPDAAAVEALTKAAKAYTDFLGAVSVANDKGAVEIVVAARQAALRDTLAGALLMRVKVHSSGGTLYTQKNFATAFGAPIFHVTGGAVVSFVLVDPTNGGVLAADTLQCSSGFHTAKQVHARTTANALAASAVCWSKPLLN